MSEAIWYYVDRQQQRNGPVSAAALAEAYAAGRVDNTSLVWREGMGAWTALIGYRAELGISGPPPSPVAVAAAAAPPARSSSRIGCVVILIVVAVVSVPMLAIMAAIAVPAYQDYVSRAQAAAALVELRGYEPMVEQYVVNRGQCPADAGAAGIQASAPETPRLTGLVIGTDGSGQCQIAGTLVGTPVLDGAKIRLVRDGSGSWTCETTISRPNYVPRGCNGT